MGRRFRRKGDERRIARRRIARLFELAHRRVLEDEAALADRSVALARRIAMRYQTGLEPTQRDRVCRDCHTYLAPGRTARVRPVDGVVRTTCLACGRVQRRPYRREQKARRIERAQARNVVRPAPPQDDAVVEPAPVTQEV